MTINAKLDAGDVLKLNVLLAGIQNGAQKAIVTGINKSGVTVRAKGVSLVTTILNLSAARVRQDFVIYKATVSDMSGGAVVATGRPVGFPNFKPSYLKSGGVSIRIFKQEGKIKFRHAFRGMTSGAEQVFLRVQKTGVGYGKKVDDRRQYAALPEEYRLPVKRMEGPRVEDILGGSVYDDWAKFAGDTAIKNIDAQAEYLIKRYG